MMACCEIGFYSQGLEGKRLGPIGLTQLLRRLGHQLQRLWVVGQQAQCSLETGQCSLRLGLELQIAQVFPYLWVTRTLLAQPSRLGEVSRIRGTI